MVSMSSKVILGTIGSLSWCYHNNQRYTFIFRGMLIDFSQMKNKGLVSDYHGASFGWTMNKLIIFYSIYQSWALIRKQLFWHTRFKKKLISNRILFVSRKSLGFIYSWPDTISKKKSALSNKKWLMCIEEFLNVTQDLVITVRLKMH